MASTYADVFAAFKDERPLYCELAETLERIVRERVDSIDVLADVSARAKEVDSFAIKAILKGYQDPLAEILDKAGVRVNVLYLDDIDRVIDALREDLEILNTERKLDSLAYYEAGYLGVHLDAQLRDERVAETDSRFTDLRFEVQIRTKAQAVWAEVSHDQLYKSPADLPDELKRIIYRLVSIVELVDLEVARFVAEARATPGTREVVVLHPLRKELLERFNIGTKPDRRLSLIMCAAVVPLYDVEPHEVYEERLQDWIDDNEDAIRVQLDDGRHTKVNPLIHQPEVLMIFERLSNDRVHLEESWPDEVPRVWLLDLAEMWGTPIE